MVMGEYFITDSLAFTLQPLRAHYVAWHQGSEKIIVSQLYRFSVS